MDILRYKRPNMTHFWHILGHGGPKNSPIPTFIIFVGRPHGYPQMHPKLVWSCPLKCPKKQVKISLHRNLTQLYTPPTPPGGVGGAPYLVWVLWVVVRSYTPTLSKIKIVHWKKGKSYGTHRVKHTSYIQGLLAF